jgi:hypothetical protein
MWTVVSCPDSGFGGGAKGFGSNTRQLRTNSVSVARVLAPAGLRSSPVLGAASRPSGSKLPRHSFSVPHNFSAVLRTAFFMPALLRHATGGRRDPSHLAFSPRIAHDIGFIQGLAGAFRGWRRCGGSWRWRTGTAAENDGAKYERHWSKNAFPKTVHRMTREKGCTHGCDNKTPP